MPLTSSASDPICPTFAAGTFSLIGPGSSFTFNNDSASPSGANGYVNQVPSNTVGSFNNDWANNVNSQNILPVFRSGLLSFGNTGLQS